MRDFIFFMCGMVFQTMLFAGGFADNYALLALAFIFCFSCMMYSQFRIRYGS